MTFSGIQRATHTGSVACSADTSSSNTIDNADQLGHVLHTSAYAIVNRYAEVTYVRVRILFFDRCQKKNGQQKQNNTTTTIVRQNHNEREQPAAIVIGNANGIVNRVVISTVVIDVFYLVIVTWPRACRTTPKLRIRIRLYVFTSAIIPIVRMGAI